ncbi:hypothetical protein [Miltoncostaea marina]|uniref:hypothetical protein n=1 Tax=Miltoncostaea marina TaxID=2843215 RepID=UPI001C3E58CD|nr:hypothetical protein [Miltoncostaea marina]
MSELPPVIGVPEVMARYGLRDRRAARRLMDAAGGFLVAGHLVVRVDDLAAWERAQAAARRAPVQAAQAARNGRRTHGKAAATSTGPRAPLAPGWWRDDRPAA